MRNPSTLRLGILTVLGGVIGICAGPFVLLLALWQFGYIRASGWSAFSTDQMRMALIASVILGGLSLSYAGRCVGRLDILRSVVAKNGGVLIGGAVGFLVAITQHTSLDAADFYAWDVLIGMAIGAVSVLAIQILLRDPRMAEVDLKGDSA